MDKKPEAAAQLGYAIRQQPDFIEARIALAQLMMDVGNLPGAHEQLKAALRINQESLPLLAAAKRWDALMKEAEKAATQPSTTRATSGPTTNISSEIFTAPTTRPSK
jgi:hypothetical protein